MNSELLTLDPATLTYDQVRALANDALRDIADALISHADHDHWGDDCGDYLNAANDQLTFLTALLVDSDPDDAVAGMRWLLTASRDDIDDNRHPEGLGIYLSSTYPGGFIMGYADHATAISELMTANKED